MSAARALANFMEQPGEATKMPAKALGIAHPYLLDRMIDSLFDKDMYENEIVDPPSASAILAASNFLGDAVKPAYLHHIEIDPHCGDINVTWRNRPQGRRVKVTFVKNSNAVLLYYEVVHNGRVVDSDLTDATTEKLRAQIDWMYD